MAETMFPLENTDYNASDAQLWFATRLSGVYTNGHLAVSSTGGMDVSIAPGIAWLHYTEYGGAVYCNSLPLAKTVPLSPADYPRVDRVVIRYDAVTNIGAIAIKTGAPASSPVPPALTRDASAYEISLARIAVGKGVTEITAADITDERLDESVCGLMRDGVTGIDTSMLQSQAMTAVQNTVTAANAALESAESKIQSSLENAEEQVSEKLSDIQSAYENAIDGTLAGQLQIEVSGKANIAKNADIELLPANWTGTEAPYHYTLETGILFGEENAAVSPANVNGTEAYAAIMDAQMMCESVSFTNQTVTLRAQGTKPEIPVWVHVTTFGGGGSGENTPGKDTWSDYYEGIDLSEKFSGEIAGYQSKWTWIKARIASGNFAGMRVGDYLPFTTTNGRTFHAQIAGINTYKGYGDSEVGNHIDFITRELWPDAFQMNPVNFNNGTSSDKQVPWLASNGYLFVNSLAGQVPNSDKKPLEMVDVDYTAGGMYLYLPDDIKEVIVEKRVWAQTRFSDSGILTNDNSAAWVNIGKLWLPDEYEVTGARLMTSIGWFNGGYAHYPIFAHSMNRLKKANGSRGNWWTSSAYAGGKSTFVRVYHTGIFDHTNASNATRAPFCFRVSA